MAKRSKSLPSVIESQSVAGVNGGTMLFQKELVVAKERPYYYWYAYQRVAHRLFKVYVGIAPPGQLGNILIAKGRRRMAEKIGKFDPC